MRQSDREICTRRTPALIALSGRVSGFPRDRIFSAQFDHSSAPFDTRRERIALLISLHAQHESMTRAQRTQRRIRTPSSELAVCVAQESLRRSRKASRSTSSSLLARRPRAPAAPLTRHARRCACLGRRWSAAGAPAVRATPSGAALKLAVGAHSDAAMASAKTARETPPISSLQRPDGVHFAA